MNDIETNIFPILNLDELGFQYDTYRIRNLRRDQDEYFQNKEALVRGLSFKLGAPVQIVERQGEPFLVIPADAESVPDKYPLVRTYVYLDRVSTGTPLDFTVRGPENDAICLRFVQFMLQAPLWRDTRLWQPSAGMPFFEKNPIDEDGGIGRYRGFAARTVVAPSGRIGLCVDVRSKYVRTQPLPVRLDRLNFRRFEGVVCIYRYGHRWYEIRVETLSDLSVSEEPVQTVNGPILSWILWSPSARSRCPLNSRISRMMLPWCATGTTEARTARRRPDSAIPHATIRKVWRDGCTSGRSFRHPSVATLPAVMSSIISRTYDSKI